MIRIGRECFTTLLEAGFKLCFQGLLANQVDASFPAMIKALRYGAPPHGGIAPGIDRMIMLLANEPNIREIIAFPLNQNAQDLLMGAPSQIDKKSL